MTVNEKEIYENSKIIMASYGSRELFGQWITSAFGFMVLFYYESVIGLESTLLALGFVLYCVWNAINDPLVGYIMEKIHMPWEKKWGVKRFPWMIAGVIPWLFSFLLIFMVPLNWRPQVDPSYNWPVFGWYLFSICLYDTCLTLYDVNVISIYPDKFRGLNERRTTQGFGTILGIIGLVLSAIIPPMFITTGVPETYRIAALVSVLFGFIIFIFVMPGIWENRRVREQYRKRREMREEEKVESFFKTVKTTITDKRFMGKVIFFYGYQVGAVMLQMSGLYIVTYLLDEEASVLTYLLGAMLIGAIFSVPLWNFASHKVNNNKRVSLIAGIIMLLTFIPMIFVSILLNNDPITSGLPSSRMIGWLVCLTLFGVALGGQWFMDPPTMGDILDDIAVRTGKRQQAIYYGFQAFFIRLGNATIAVTIAFVHILTGFPEGAPSLAELKAKSPTPELALFGIIIHSVIIPAIIILIAVILFWRMYDLTPDRVAANKEKLKELGL